MVHQSITGDATQEATYSSKLLFLLNFSAILYELCGFNGAIAYNNLVFRTDMNRKKRVKTYSLKGFSVEVTSRECKKLVFGSHSSISILVTNTYSNLYTYFKKC